MRRIWIMAGMAAAVMAVTTGAAGASAQVHPARRGNTAGTRAGPAYTPAFGISDRGVIVGDFGINGRPAEHGYVLRRGAFTTLNAPGSAGLTHAYGIDNAGDVVGEYAGARGALHGYVLHDGRYTTLNVPGSRNETIAAQINGAGDIVGSYLDARRASHG